MKLTEHQEAELKEFSETVDFWITGLSLTDWDIQVQMGKIEPNANVVLQQDGHKAYITLGVKREKGLSVKQLAIHEVLEILLADIADKIEEFYSKKHADDLVHKVINRLMPILLEFKK